MKCFLFGKQVPLSVALILLALPASGARAQEPQPDCWVLSAGVDRYPNAPKLKGCVPDARNTSAAFQAQQGKKFGKVHVQTLIDDQATHRQITQRMYSFAQQGKAGDFVVLFLSGHGGRTNRNKTWYFLPHDFHPGDEAGTTLTDRQILDASDALMRKGRRVIVIVDACFAGQLSVTAQPYLSRYAKGKAGGLILMLSSAADQTSAALGSYSAFAKAFADSMAGNADANRDGKVTLAELRTYANQRANDLIRQRGVPARQESQWAWSPSISEQMHLAMVTPGAFADNRPPIAPGRPITPGLADNRPPLKPLRPANPKTPAKSTNTKFREWSGSETLPGYGRLTFKLYDGGRAIMIDTHGTFEGSWQQNGLNVTLRFFDGKVVYAGSKRGETVSGSARNTKTTWTFSVVDKAVASSR